MFFKKSKMLLGLNIGSSHIKIVELKDSGSRYTLQNFGIAILPPDTIVDGTIMDSMAISNLLKDLAESLKIKKKQVCTSISGHSVIIKKILMPIMDEKTVENTIYDEATHHIPYDIYDVNLDFQILGPSKEAEDKMEVLLVAVKKDIINDYIGVIEGADLTPVVVDVDHFALENAYEYCYENASEEVVALVDIGANITNINVLKDGAYSFTRDITIGSRMLTEQLQKQLNLNYQVAEQLKMGIPAEGISETEAQKVIDDSSFTFTNEIAKTIDFFHTSAAGNQVEKIYLSGGGAKLPGIGKSVQELTKIKTEIFNPFANLIVPENKFDQEYIKEIAPLAAVAVGLALRKDTDK